jgi:hypothetical protein
MEVGRRPYAWTADTDFALWKLDVLHRNYSVCGHRMLAAATTWSGAIESAEVLARSRVAVDIQPTALENSADGASVKGRRAPHTCS